MRTATTSEAEDVAATIRAIDGPIELVDASGRTIGVVRRPPTEAEIARARSRASPEGKRLSWAEVVTKGSGRSARVTYNVEFSLEAAAELLRIAGVVGSAAAIRAADSIRRRLEGDPEGHGNFLSEGLYSIDEDPIRAFFSSRRNQRL